MQLPDNLGMAIKAAKRRYGCAKDADTHLVISHRHRRAISLEKQSAAAVGKETVLIPGGDDPEYQLLVGTRLIGSCTHNKFINGARYAVLQIRPDILVQDELTGEQFSATAEQVSRNSLLVWSMVYSKAQGDTPQGMVCLHDVNSRNNIRPH